MCDLLIYFNNVCSNVALIIFFKVISHFLYQVLIQIYLLLHFTLEEDGIRFT